MDMRPVSRFVHALSLTLIAVNLGCATHSQKVTSQNQKNYRAQAAKLARELKKKNQVIENLRDKNRVLAGQAKSQRRSKEPKSDVYQMPGDSFRESLRQQAREDAVMTFAPPPKPKSNVSMPYAEIDGQKQDLGNASEPAERLLYGGVMQAYRKQDREQLKNAVRVFLKTYPNSVYADNALYLGALASIESKDWTNANRALNQLLREYPSSNKAVSALFARAVVFKNQGRYADARRSLEQVKSNYPGSPESHRVALELRLINMLEKSRRKL